MCSHSPVRVAQLDLTNVLDTALRVAVEAAELVEESRAAALRATVDTKSSETDVVTAADRASEQLVHVR